MAWGSSCAGDLLENEPDPILSCAHKHRFESQQHAGRVIGDWIQFYNHRRPHQALGMKTPAEACALAA